MSGDRLDPSARRSVFSYLEESSRFADRPAYVWRRGVRRHARSWGEIRRRGAAAARSLADAGVERGDAVLIQGGDGPDWVEALLGCFHLGAVAVPLDEETDEGFRERVAAQCRPVLLLAEEGVSAPEGIERCTLGGWEETEDPPPPATIEEGDRAEIVFTSGTTGEPKGVVLTHGNLLGVLRGIERGYRKGRREWLLERLAPIPFVSTLPLSHMFGQAMGIFLPAMMGLTVVFAPPRPREAREAMRKEGAWGLFCVPRVLELLRKDLERDLREEGRLEAFEERWERWKGRRRILQALAHWRIQRRMGWRSRLFVVGGAPVPDDLRRFWDEMGYLVVVGYGLTETAPIVSISNPFRRGETVDVGRPGRDQEVKITEEGEVLVRGPNVSPGYLGADEDGSFEDDWFRTGDLGELDEEGRLRIKGRLKEVIVTPEGENVHARDVQEVLEDREGVREAVVLGLPPEGEEADGGERVHAVLLLEPGTEAREVVRAANEKLQARQRIRGHTVWSGGDLPRTPTGKVRRAALRDALLAMREGRKPEEALQDTGAEVRAVVARVAGVDREELTDETALVEDLGLTSLDLVELAAELEESWGLELSEERLQEADLAELEALVGDVEKGGTRGGRSASRVSRERGKAEEGPVRGELAMPRWSRRRPVHWLRRAVEEAVMFPFVRFYSRPEVEGLEHVEALDEPFLVVANHPSHFDTGLLKAVLPSPHGGRLAPGAATRNYKVFYGERAGTRSEYLRQALAQRLVQFFFHAWPLPETAGFRRSLAYAGELADEGFDLLLFPQGRLVDPEEEVPFREGIGVFARELGLPVVPAWLEGTREVLPPRAAWPRRGRTRVVFGAPLGLRDEEDSEAFARRLEETVRGLAP